MLPGGHGCAERANRFQNGGARDSRIGRTGAGMSLINDALRRATTQETKRDPTELPAMQPTFRPVRTGGPGFSIFVVCFLMAAALTLGAWFYYKRGLAAKAAAPPKPAPTANTNNNPLARAS